MKNKELIERIDMLIMSNHSKGTTDALIDCKKALQDAEADAKKQAAIHLYEEAKLLEEINYLRVELEDEEETTEMLSTNLVELKAKLSEQVDPIELIEFTANKYGFKLEIGKSIAEKVFEQFKKERKTN